MLEEALKQIEKVFSESPATKWINSPEVTAWCEESRKERELSAPAEIIPLPNRALRGVSMPGMTAVLQSESNVS